MAGDRAGDARDMDRDRMDRDRSGLDRGYGSGADSYSNNAPARKVRMAREWPDGSRYDGEWLAGKRHGEGTFTFAKGGRYAGAWADDERDGRGTFYYADTSMYEGEWRKSKRHGI